ncbi:MAG TPA: phasin [Xanthobacteraceae bacterium]|jgi:phasin|nr:phasin [Xanthobacteraceae bacterium]
MTEASTVKTKTAKPVANPVSSIFDTPRFDLPNFDLSKFDLPKMEIPAAFRDIAERGIAQAKDNYEKAKAAAEQTTDLLENTYTTAAKGTADYNLKVLEAGRTNVNAAFDYAQGLLSVKSFSEFMELSTAHARKQFETLTGQSRELTALAQKVATETTEPLKSGLNKALKVA